MTKNFNFHASLSLKQCRIILEIANSRSESDASKELNMTQSNVSRNLAAAEKALGCKLFLRGWGGSDPTQEGEIVISYCRQIIVEVAKTEKIISGTSTTGTTLNSYLEWRHLDIVIAIVNLGSASAAANYFGLSQPSVSRTIKDLERMTRQTLFIRKRHGLESTDASRLLATLKTIITPLIESIPHALSTLPDTLVGRLYVGMLPISCQDIIPKAFSRLIDESQHIQLHAVQAPYRMLIKSLRNGEIDCFIGLMRNLPSHSDLIELPLVDAHYAVIARANHPIHKKYKNLKDLKNQRWIVAPHGTPIRTFFEYLCDHIGESAPAQTIEMLTFRSAEHMIKHSNAIGILVHSNNYLDDLDANIKTIDIDVPNAKCAIGITHRKNDTQPVLKRFIDILNSIIQ